MGDDITIGVTEIVNNIEVTAQPNDQIVDISVIDNTDEVTLNITPTVIEINVNKGSSYAKWGTILGTLSDQEDLQDALDLKANLVDGKVPASELPSYVDDIIEVANYAALPTTGEIGKIYVTLDNNKIYRWSGSIYIEIAANNAIWGAITGTLSNQLDLQAALDTKALKTITITPNAPLSGGGDLSSNRTLSITQANTTTDGYLSSTDWNTFNSKLSSLSGAVLTTTDQTVAGVKKFTDGLTSDKAYNQKIISGTFMPDAGYGNFFQNDRQITFVQFNSAATAVTQFSFIYPASNTNQFYYLPDASGTLALISDAINNGVTTIAPSQNAVFDALALKQNVLTNPITGSTLLSGNTGDGYVPRASGSTTLTNSNIYDNGTNVGIGTTSPDVKFQVQGGTIKATTSNYASPSTGGAISMFQDSNDYGTIWAVKNYNGAWANIAIAPSGGNVGIGTTSPDAYYSNKLVVSCAAENGITIANIGTTGTNYLMFADGTSGDDRYRGFIAYEHTPNNLLFATNASEKMRITSGGNLLIGTTTDAGNKLEVNGTGRFSGNLRSTNEMRVASSAYPSTYNTSLRSDASANGILQLGNNNDNYIIAGNTNAGGYLIFRVNASAETLTSGIEAMRITSGGNLSIGNTNNTYKLDVSGQSVIRASATNGIALQAVATDGNATIYLRPNNSGYNLISSNYLSSSPYLPLVLSARENSSDLVLATNGNVGIGTTSPTSKLQVVGLPSYTDNTTALAGGLTVGAFYHTAGVLKVVI